MDNQQRKTVGLDFVAGILTGEGSFALTVQRLRGERLRIKPILYLQMNDTETMNLVADSLRSNGLPVYEWDDPKRPRKTITIGGMKRVSRYVETFLPLLTGAKREAAEIVGQFISSRMAGEPQAPYTQEQIDLVKKLRSVNGNRNGKKTPL